MKHDIDTNISGEFVLLINTVNQIKYHMENR